MNPEDYRSIEQKRQALLGQLKAAESALRGGLHAHGFGSSTRAHMERAMAHIHEAYLTINEGKTVRTVPQLVDDLNRIQQFMEQTEKKNHRSQHI